MAVSTANYFSNSIPSGELTVGAGIDLFTEQSTTAPKFAMGTRALRADGNVYRYVHFGATVNAGEVVAPDLNESAQIYTSNAVIDTSSVFQQLDESNGTYPGMIGSRYIVIQHNGITKDQFAGGYIAISSGTGLGYTYRIKGNKASSGTATTISLHDPIVVGLDATSDISIGPSKYSNLEAGIGLTTQNGLPVGVAVRTISTAGNFGWVLTRGVIGVRQSGTLVTGKLARLSDTDAGHVEPWGNGAAASSTGSGLVALLDGPVVGTVLLATASSGHALIDVKLE